MRGWLTGRTTASSALSLNALDEPQALENALHGASHIMNDDIEAAEAELSKGTSAFHYLGLGLVGFMKAVLGFEKDMMAEASKRLNEAETRAYNGYRGSLRHQTQGQQSIYSPGSEYLLCQAEVQIMGAVIGVLTESVTESIKGFYKLRKAFLTLDAIIEEEKVFLSEMRSKSASSAAFEKINPDDSSEHESKTTDTSQSPAIDSRPDVDPESDAEEFYDVAEAPEEIPIVVKRASTIKSRNSRIAEDLNGMSIKDEDAAGQPQSMRRFSSQIQDGPDAELFSNYVDAFVHSSSNMCYGMLLLLLSMLPPAFAPLIRIAGFKGDRKRGIALLWQASKFGNLNGAFAGLILLGYYNGFVGFCDILPTTGSGAFPEARCQELLRTSRQRFPKSSLWMIEETRIISNQKNLDGGIEMLEKIPESKLQQVRALHCFETAMNYLFVHRYNDCSIAFHKLISLNNWSHGLYYYISACCHVELYREFRDTDPTKAAEQRRKVEELVKKIPDHIGKKKIMARQLPFDIFVQRKLDKWHQRSKENNIPMIDAIGVSPVCEMIYFWNGFKRMNHEQLEYCQIKLDWSIKNSKISWETEVIDEKGVKALLSGVVLRHMGKTQKARLVLQEGVMNHSSTLFKTNYRDNWVPPAARYETAVTYWVDHLQTGKVQELEEAQKLLDIAAAWEAYDLDVRVGLRVKTGLETVKRQKEGSV